MPRRTPGPGESVVLRSADVDLDGRPDLISAAGDRGELYWHRNLGDGFTKPLLISDDVGQVVVIKVADLDGDDHADFVLASSDQSRIVWFEFQDGWQVQTIAESLYSIDSLVVADLDGDGDNDVAISPTEEHPFLWFSNNAGSFEPNHLDNIPAQSSRINAADWDNDGDLDLLIAYQILENGRTRVYADVLENVGGGEFAAPEQIDQFSGIYRPIDLDFVDLTDDGERSLVWALTATVSSRGRIDGFPSVSPSLSGLYSMEFVDVEMDGDLDIAAGTESEVTLMLHTGGDGIAVRQSITTQYSQQVAVADFDGDGDPDIASSGFDLTGEGLVWHRNNVDVTNIEGDFSSDRNVNEEDLLLICGHVESSVNDVPDGQRYDFNADGRIDLDDMAYFRAELYSVRVGDANFDGRFNSSDLVDVFARGQYEDGVVENSLWTDGDWNCDKEFDSSDFVFALTEGSYSAFASPAFDLSDAAASLARKDPAPAATQTPTEEMDSPESTPGGRPQPLESVSAIDTLFATKSRSLGDSANSDDQDEGSRFGLALNGEELL